MIEITEQQILTFAPNASAASNGKKISQKGGFVKLERTSDNTLYIGECKGSGNSHYITSADYINQAEPVFRCTCPSRQYPCKHSLALLYEILAGKEFSICEVPEDILRKREKKKARDNKASKPESEMTEEELKKAEKKKASAAKSAKNAKIKKLKSQLKGLDLADKMTDSLVMAGLGTIGGASLKSYQDIIKQMGDYYLTGPQKLCNQLLIEITKFQKDGSEIHYDNAIDILKKLHTLVKKSRQYIENKLASDDASLDDNMLYEELGGVWKLTELEEAGRGIENKNFVQLSFWIDYSESAKLYTDTGCWICLEDGNIYINYNYRPLKAVKYIKQDDSVFGVASVPRAATYPGDGNLRIRWENAQIRDLTEEDYNKITGFAPGSINAGAKAIKNTLKNTLAQPMLLQLIKYQKIARCDYGFVLISESGDNILLGDMPGMEQTTPRIEMLPGSYLLKNQVMLAAFYYNNRNRRLQAQPLSIITKNSIVRLLY
ncbi:MAG: hypothetical protein HFH68_08030 [Lachnospiraceae bacterium]|nr:hypothetical protein [Lachnospiraceae bacterium]